MHLVLILCTCSRSIRRIELMGEGFSTEEESFSVVKWLLRGGTKFSVGRYFGSTTSRGSSTPHQLLLPARPGKVGKRGWRKLDSEKRAVGGSGSSSNGPCQILSLFFELLDSFSLVLCLLQFWCRSRDTRIRIYQIIGMPMKFGLCFAFCSLSAYFCQGQRENGFQDE